MTSLKDEINRLVMIEKGRITDPIANMIALLLEKKHDLIRIVRIGHLRTF